MVTMDTPPTLHERLKAAMEASSVTHAHLAAQLDKARSAVTHWCTGRNEPEREDLVRIATLLNVRVAWLAFGDGPMVDDAAVPDSDEHAAAPSSATATQLDGTPCTEAA